MEIFYWSVIYIYFLLHIFSFRSQFFKTSYLNPLSSSLFIVRYPDLSVNLHALDVASAFLVTPESNTTALTAMKLCQIRVL